MKNYLSKCLAGSLCLVAIFLPVIVSGQQKSSAYRGHDIAGVLIVEKGEDGQRSFSMDLELVDAILKDLTPHARDFPTKFASKKDATRARQDVSRLSIILVRMTRDDDADTGLLHRSALLHSMAHNMGLKTAAVQVNRCYKLLLERFPNDAQTNYLYGTFLGSTKQITDAIHYLDRAHRLGFESAAYTLGLIHAANGNKRRALNYLLLYQEQHPDDRNVSRMIEAVEKGRIKQSGK